jgi:DNA-binding NarL/FixJ family response regulator
MNKAIHITIADPQYLTRLGIARAVQKLSPSAGITETGSSEELWAILDTHQSDILIIDIELLDFSIPEDFFVLQKKHPEMRIMVITDDFDAEKISSIWDTKVNAFILKNAEDSEFELAFMACIKNQKHYAVALVDIVMRLQNKKKGPHESSTLTPSEQDIVRLIAQGLTTKEIAAQKFLSFHTIITHRRNIFKKLGINNSSELLMHAVKTGIVQTNDYYI